MTVSYTPEDAVFAEGPWTHRDVAANGARFHTVTMGEGPLVLLLHGFPMFWWTWRNLLPELAENGYRAVAMDMRGYAGSDHPPRGYDLFTLARDTASVIRSLGERDAVVVGHGMGGLVAWSTAALHPETVTHLVAVSCPHPVRMRTAITHDRAQFAAQRYVLGFQRPWVPERQLVANDGALVEDLLRRWSGDPSWPDEDVAARFRAAFQLGHTAHCSVEYHRWAFRSIPRSDGRRFTAAMRAHPISAPVLHIQGANDKAVLPRSSDGSETFVTGTYEWQLLQGIGHLPHEEAPKQFNSTLLEWLRPPVDPQLPGTNTGIN